MNLIPLKTRLIQENDDLIKVIQEALNEHKEKLQDGDILAIASKAVSYCEGMLENNENIENTVNKESDKYFGEGVMKMTIKHKILIPNAGIDDSNAPDNKVILWPKDPFKSAETIRQKLVKKFNLENLGVVITDSHCQPLRIGTVGIALGWAGFKGIKDERGNHDLYDQKMKYTQVAIADDLACAANLLMGETNAQIPMVIIEHAPVEWTDILASAEDYWMNPQNCIFNEVYSENLKNT